jgi:hypothetical protein
MCRLSAYCLPFFVALVFGACDPEIGGCPDPALATFSTRDFAFGFPVTIEVAVINVGGADFVSGPGQQEVQLYREGVLVASREFPGDRLNVGASFSLTYEELEGNPGDTIRWQGIIVYAPDVFADGNEANDDCNLENNTLEIITF